MYKINKTNLSKQKKFRLSEIIGIKIFFHQNINQRKLFSKKLSKYVTAFDYIDKILTVLSAASSGVCWSTNWNRKYNFYFNCFSNNKNNQSLTKHNKSNKKKKHDKILIFAKSKIDSIETIVSQALIDLEINHEELNAIIKKKKK